MPSNNALAITHETGIDWATLEKVVIQGDLEQLSPADRVGYYRTVCESLGLNPATKPFGYIKFRDGGLQLYAKKDAAEQLRRVHGVSITRIEKSHDGGIYTVTAYAQTRDGRTDVDEGAVSIEGLKGNALANAYKRALTQAKRRVTLSICGLGFLDETEVDQVPGAQAFEATDSLDASPRRQQPPRQVNRTTGEIDDLPETITPEIVKGLYALSDELGLERTDFEATLRKRYRIGHPLALTVEQAADARERLMTALTKRQQADAQRADEDAELARIGELVDAELAAAADEEGA